MTLNENAAEIGFALNAYHDKRGFVIERDEHSIEMVLADLILFARSRGVSFDAALKFGEELAGETIADLQTA